MLADLGVLSRTFLLFLFFDLSYGERPSTTSSSRPADELGTT